MSKKIWKVGLIPLLLWIVSAQRSADTYSYSWQGSPKTDWEDLSPMFDFQSKRIGPNSKRSESAFEQLVSVPEPSVVPASYGHHSNSHHAYPFSPEFGDHGNGFVHSIPSHSNRKGVHDIREEVDVSRERMGGFGGTGDMLGYGAYEYKSTKDNKYASSFSDIMRLPRSKGGSFIDRFLSEHPLQNL